MSGDSGGAASAAVHAYLNSIIVKKPELKFLQEISAVFI
jgi:hypothetical protein